MTDTVSFTCKDNGIENYLNTTYGPTMAVVLKYWDPAHRDVLATLIGDWLAAEAQRQEWFDYRIGADGRRQVVFDDATGFPKVLVPQVVFHLREDTPSTG